MDGNVEPKVFISSELQQRLESRSFSANDRASVEAKLKEAADIWNSVNTKGFFLSFDFNK
jgi:hypothetical protein